MAKKKYKCSKCLRSFDTSRGLAIHDSSAHPFVPTPPPRKVTKRYMGESTGHNLLNGDRIKLGDKLVFTQRVVVKQITRTEDTRTAIVDVHKISDRWAHE